MEDEVILIQSAKVATSKIELELNKRRIIFLFLFDKGALQGCVLKRGKLFGGGRFIMCFMTALSSVAGGALTSKTIIVFGFGSHKDHLLART